jgi:hypothetical protein
MWMTGVGDDVIHGQRTNVMNDIQQEGDQSSTDGE